MLWFFLIFAAILWLLLAIYFRLKKLRKNVDEQRSKIAELREKRAGLLKEHERGDEVLALENKIIFLTTGLMDMILIYNEAIYRFPTRFIAPLFGHKEQFLNRDD